MALLVSWGSKSVRLKLPSHSHQEFNTAEIANDLERLVTSGVDRIPDSWLRTWVGSIICCPIRIGPSPGSSSEDGRGAIIQSHVLVGDVLGQVERTRERPQPPLGPVTSTQAGCQPSDVARHRL